MPYFKRAGSFRSNGALKNKPVFGMKYPGLVSSVGRSPLLMSFVSRRCNRVS